MRDRYDRAVEAVVAYLRENGHADTTVTGTRGCLKELKAHLVASGHHIYKGRGLGMALRQGRRM